jgi:hypothetical protein
MDSQTGQTAPSVQDERSSSTNGAGVKINPFCMMGLLEQRGKERVHASQSKSLCIQVYLIWEEFIMDRRTDLVKMSFRHDRGRKGMRIVYNKREI